MDIRKLKEMLGKEQDEKEDPSSSDLFRHRFPRGEPKCRWAGGTGFGKEMKIKIEKEIVEWE